MDEQEVTRCRYCDSVIVDTENVWETDTEFPDHCAVRYAELVRETKAIFYALDNAQHEPYIND